MPIKFLEHLKPDMLIKSSTTIIKTEGKACTLNEEAWVLIYCNRCALVEPLKTTLDGYQFNSPLALF